LLPFSNGVWLLIVGAVLVNALFHYALHKLSGAHADPEQKQKQRRGKSLYSSAIGLTGTPEEDPGAQARVCHHASFFLCLSVYIYTYLYMHT
jgi:hypothetical protein